MSAACDTLTVKTCCATLYVQDWVRFILSDTFHPGGIALTRHLGATLQLTPNNHLLDIAAGPGTSAIEIARTFGCRVTAIDFSAEQVGRAAAAVRAAGLADRVTCVQGDAECLPFAANSFDAILCECAFCTFPNKRAAGTECYRVVRAHGRLAFSDIALDPTTLSPTLRGILGVVACIADARPASEYIAILSAAGFVNFQVEDHAAALEQILCQIERRLFTVKVAAALGKLQLGNLDLTKAHPLIAEVRSHIAAGNATYITLLASTSY